jgi:hypothetical protein
VGRDGFRLLAPLLDVPDLVDDRHTLFDAGDEPPAAVEERLACEA